MTGTHQQWAWSLFQARTDLQIQASKVLSGTVSSDQVCYKCWQSALHLLYIDVIYITKEKEDIATERYETMSESFYMMKVNLVIGHKLICSACKKRPVVHSSDYWQLFALQVQCTFIPNWGFGLSTHISLKKLIQSHPCDLSGIVDL